MIKKRMIWLIKNTVYRLYNIIGKLYLAPVLWLEWKRPPFHVINERVIEYEFVLKWLSRICPSEILDVGPGTSCWPDIMAHCGFRVTAIDKIRGYWKSGYLNRHYLVFNNDITKPNIDKQFDLITCISVLEHISDHMAAIKGMFSLLKNGGHLIITVPYNHKQYIEDVYRLPGVGYGSNNPYICQVFSAEQIDNWLSVNAGTIVEQEYYEVFTGDLWAFGERIYPLRKTGKEQKCHLTCILIQKKQIK